MNKILLSLFASVLLPSCIWKDDAGSNAQVAARSRATATPTPAPVAACTGDLSPYKLGIRGGNGWAKLELCTNFFDTHKLSSIVVSIDGKESRFAAVDVTKATGLNGIIGALDPYVLEAKSSTSSISITGTGGQAATVKSGASSFSGFPSEGDPSEPCFGSFGGTENVFKSFDFGTARFRVSLCKGAMGSSGTTVYQVIGVEVEDSSKNLPTRLKVSLTGATLAERMVVEHNHHNECDSLAIKLDGVSYGLRNAKSVSGTPCSVTDKVVPVVPAGSFKARLRATYGTKVEEGDLTFANIFD